MKQQKKPQDPKCEEDFTTESTEIYTEKAERVLPQRRGDFAKSAKGFL
jgi:hypothetical protein